MTPLSKKFNWSKSIFLLAVGFTFTLGGANFVVESGTKYSTPTWCK